MTQLAILALEKADIRERRYLEAKLLRNEAQIIIRNKKDDKCTSIEQWSCYLWRMNTSLRLKVVSLKVFFVKDEKLRTTFEMLKSNRGGEAEEIDRIIKEYIDLDQEFDKFTSDAAEAET